MLPEDGYQVGVVFVGDRGGKEAVDSETLPVEMLPEVYTLFRG